MNAFDLLPKLIRATYDSDRKTIEAVSLMLIKKIKKEYPDTAKEIANALTYSGLDGSSSRSVGSFPLPVDKETRDTLGNFTEYYEFEDPILDDYTRVQLEDFIKEREMMEVFLNQNIVPSNSMILVGAPGVGKTFIAKWLAYRLNLPLITLDLAASISSYLGRSGQNIKNLFDYAKSMNSILFLDELDAIAKKRDDSGDLGELKRLVNVLLKELEDCPSNCIIIGATNHPELLDKAIWRRFDRHLTINMPSESERERLFIRHLGEFLKSISSDLLSYLVKFSIDINAADICKLCEHIKRQTVLNPNLETDLICLTELFKVVELNNKNEKKAICENLRLKFPKLTQREISNITRVPLTTVSRYLSLNKEGKNE